MQSGSFAKPTSSSAATLPTATHACEWFIRLDPITRRLVDRPHSRHLGINHAFVWRLAPRPRRYHSGTSGIAMPVGLYCSGSPASTASRLNRNG